jgi:hypothetical protein
MSDTPLVTDEPVNVQAVTQALAGVGEQLTAKQLEIFQAQFAAAQADAERRATEMYQRWVAEQAERQKLMSWCQDHTTASMQHQYAIPCTTDALFALLSETPAPARAKWQTFLSDLRTSGFVSFEEIGSGRGGDDRSENERAIAEYEAFVQKQIASGMAASAAYGSVPKDLMARYNAAKGGR